MGALFDSFFAMFQPSASCNGMPFPIPLSFPLSPDAIGNILPQQDLSIEILLHIDVLDLAEIGLTFPTAAFIVLYFALVARKVLVTHQFFRALLSSVHTELKLSPTPYPHPQMLLGWE